MNILMVSTYPPTPCGIGSYAAQQAEALRREGHLVDVLSPRDSGGDLHDDLLGGIRPLRLLKYAWAYEQVYLHFTQQFFFRPHGKFNRILTSLAFVIVMLLAGRRFSFIKHEATYKLDETARRGLRVWLDRLWWGLMGRVIFHTARERDAFCEFYRFKPDRKGFEIWTHGDFFEKRYTSTREKAREELGVERDATVLLCIGFVQPHKGFDRPLEAMRMVTDAPHLRVRIVGSVRLNYPQMLAYAERLRTLCEMDDRCEFVEGYLDDETFDQWIVASDYVVIPYREIWSSSVAARARLHGRPMIAANTGGLAEQLTEGSILFDNDGELVNAIRRVAGNHEGAATGHAQHA